MPSSPHILVVEDDPDLSDLCGRLLERAGYRVDLYGDGEAALNALEGGLYELALLDWHLPGLSGQALMEAICWRWPELPIIVMTGFSDEDKAVAAVQYAQAYLRKPFDNDEFYEAVSRVLHRSRTSHIGSNGSGEYPVGQPRSAGTQRRRAGEIEINPLRCEATFGERPPQALTATEYALLNRLFVDVGEVVSHQALAKPISGRELSQREAATLCKHHIRAMRSKLEPDPAHPRYIVTVRGQGYRLDP